MNGSFVAIRNQLTTLEGGPQYVKDNLFIGENQLTSLQFAPQFVGSLLDFSFNEINQILNTTIEFNQINHTVLSDEEKLKGCEDLYIKFDYKTQEGNDT